MMTGKTVREQGTIDSSSLTTAYIDAFEVLSSPGEVVLLFGNVQSAAAVCDNSLSAALAARVILSPYIAKRFAALLNNKIREYEAAFGVVSEEVLHPIAQESNPFYDEISRYASEETAEKARQLFQLINRLNVAYGLERSCKMSSCSLLINRFIMGFRKDDLIQDQDEKTAALFRQMGMPERYQEECRQLLSKTEFVHVGFEEQHEGCLYKAYLEFKAHLKFSPDGIRVPQEPFLVFLGFKWDPFDNRRCALSRYTCYPLLSPEEIEEKLSCLIEQNPGYKSFETAKNILHDSVKIVSNNKIIYEEVGEENNPRKSFDMNLYGANLRIRDIYPDLMEIGRHYSLSAGQLIPLFERISDKMLGHLSGGVDREGKDFFTVYYGVEAIDAGRPSHEVDPAD